MARGSACLLQQFVLSSSLIACATSVSVITRTGAAVSNGETRGERKASSGTVVGGSSLIQHAVFNKTVSGAAQQADPSDQSSEPPLRYPKPKAVSDQELSAPLPQQLSPQANVTGFNKLMEGVDFYGPPGNGLSVIIQSLILVGIAEMFDKTWFIALLMALRYDKVTVFTGSYLALVVHTGIAAGLGLAISKLFAAGTLCFVAAGLYGAFALFCFWDWLKSSDDTDVFTTGKEEASATMDRNDTDRPNKGMDYQFRALCQCFVGVFVAEWGDRTQIAMVSQHASQPLIPVCIGSAAAFFVLTISAVLVASLLDRLKLTEGSVSGFSALSFGIFSGIAFYNGFQEINGKH